MCLARAAAAWGLLGPQERRQSQAGEARGARLRAAAAQ